MPKRKYPINNLAIGESVVLPWFSPIRRGGPRMPTRPIKMMQAAVYQHWRKTGEEFATEPTDTGLKVTRIA